jgi:hypothetical protein
VSKITPQVVLLGKGKGDGLKATHEIIKNIQPSSIPPELLDSVLITVVGEKQYKVDPELLKFGIDYSNLNDHLSRLGLQEEIKLVEIVINLDKTQKHLSEASNTFLALFDE